MDGVGSQASAVKAKAICLPGALALEGFPGILELSIIFSASVRLLLGASKLN